MLYIQDQSGAYLPAPKDAVFTEARRLSGYQLRRGVSIKSSDAAKAAIGNKLRACECEMFACLFLDSGHRVLAWVEMFRGSVNCATVHPREVVKEALRLNAAAVILAHNHPSGDSTPSRQDIELTDKLREILKVIDVRVLDHLIVGDEVTAMSDSGHFLS
ncbi:MAG: DNA repair protein [Deltaproteobacteria bacterium RIFOXYD12_FULL_57_12]|nr:MAG: DNA repair protein [Deltaproteobacteria bacterium RIFOXYD12_FULL_57_12]